MSALGGRKTPKNPGSDSKILNVELEITNYAYLRVLLGLEGTGDHVRRLLEHVGTC
jgi:hypothetical protein